MKRSLWRSGLVFLTVSVLALASSMACLSADATPPAGEKSVSALRNEALGRLTQGQFEAGNASLAKALKLAPDDDAARRINGWVSSFMERQCERAKQQKDEFDVAVTKVKHLLVIARAGQSETKGFDDARAALTEAREVIEELLGAPTNAENYTGPQWHAKRLKTDLPKVSEKIDDALKAIGDDDKPYVKTLHAAAARLKTALTAYADTGGKLKWESAKIGVHQNVEAMEAEADGLTEAFDDLGSMVSKKPWQAALDWMRVIKQIAIDDTSYLKTPWAVEIIAGAMKQAKAAEDAHEWYESLALYSGLEDLHGKKGLYKEHVRAASRGARVLALYGPPHGLDDGTSTDPPKRPKWKDYIIGVDARSVRVAIARIEEAYVENVDYRKLLLGAMRAVRALGESEKLAYSFAGIKSKAKRTEFLKILDGLIVEAKEQDLVDHATVRHWLYRATKASNATVEIPDEVITVEFTDGMMEKLDRFSQMIWPEDWASFKKMTMGSFSGVGIQIQMENGLLKVSSPLEDTPAYRAGIQAGDFIVKIDGTSAENIDIEEAVKRITGVRGTKVVLTVKRPGRAPFDKTLVRDKIVIQTVKGWKRVNSGGWDWFVDPTDRIGYIRLTNFTRDTVADLAKALASLRESGARGLILDLRFNPGGLLTGAIRVTDQFVQAGTIVSTKGRQQRRSSGRATTDGSFLDGELIVLVNEYSASAAEIVSGALKDLGRAVIVGGRSFGKGSVQNLTPIREDSVYLKVTTAYYYLPGGRCLHRTEDATEWGVEPDIKSAVTPKQARKWLALRRKTEVVRERTDAELEREMLGQRNADVQLDTALLICRLRLMRKGLQAGVAKVTVAE